MRTVPTSRRGQLPAHDTTSDVVLPREYIPFPDQVQRIHVQPGRIVFSFDDDPEYDTWLEAHAYGLVEGEGEE